MSLRASRRAIFSPDPQMPVGCIGWLAALLIFAMLGAGWVWLILG